MLKKNKRRYRIVYNDDGGTLKGVSRVEELLEKAVDPLVGTQVDALFWCVGCPGGHVHFKSKTHYIYGESLDRFDTVYEWEFYRSVKRLLEASQDYLEALAKRAHEAGMEFFPSFRMNDVHDGPAPFGGSRAEYGRFKEEHPEFLLGDAVHPWFKTAHNYAFPEVREYKLAVIEEAVKRYGGLFDGVELDLLRHHYYFKPEEAYRSRYLVTDMVRRVRKLLDEAGEDKGNALSLAVRVPPTFEIASRIGFDIQTWIDEELIDILVAATPRGTELNLPIKEFVQATRVGTCQILACLGWYFSPEKARAAALNYWKAGVDGIYVFNWFATKESRREPLKEIGDPELIARRNKRYVVDQQQPIPWAIAHPKGQLPINLQKLAFNRKAEVKFIIGDDLDSVIGENALADVKLRLRLENLTEEDTLYFKMNGTALEEPMFKPVKDRLGVEREMWWEFHVSSPPLKSGENRLEATVERRNQHLTCPLLLSEVELLISYKNF